MSKRKKIPIAIALLEGGTTLITLESPLKCGCGQMAVTLVNRLGKTRCIDCDRAFIKRMKAGQGMELWMEL